MSKFKAVVFTRPYSIGFGDYTFFERPAEFARNRLFDAHVRNVLHEDDGGEIGSIKDRRWHVLRCGDYVIVGMATNEFDRRDEAKRPIRGYYGFAMPATSVKLPSLDLFKELDRTCVEPVFMHESIKTKDAEFLSGEIFDDPLQYIDVVDSGEWQFNFCESTVRFHVYKELIALLSSAIATAATKSVYEIVVGLNTVEHAKMQPIMNCVCHEVSVAQDIARVQGNFSNTGETEFNGHLCLTDSSRERLVSMGRAKLKLLLDKIICNKIARKVRNLCRKSQKRCFEVDLEEDTKTFVRDRQKALRETRKLQEAGFEKREKVDSGDDSSNVASAALRKLSSNELRENSFY